MRPTADRTRESLFNILEHGRIAAEGAVIAGANVLDGFAGAGALGLEALSRGAGHVWAMEREHATLRLAETNAASLGVSDRFSGLAADVLRPPMPSAAASLVLLDPPYGEALGAPAIRALNDAGWIADSAVVSLETGAKERFSPPPGFTLIDERRYGRAKLWLMRKA